MSVAKLIFPLILSFFAWGQTDTNRLSLRECIRIAQESSPYRVRISGDRDQARAGILFGFSTVLPQVFFNSGYTRSGPEINPYIDIPEAPPIFTDEFSTSFYQTSFTISQPLIDLSSWMQLRQAYKVADAAEVAFRGSQAELIFNVKQSFYELIRLYRNVEVSEAAVAQSKEQVQIAQERFRLGSIARPELLRVQVSLNDQRVELIQARSRVSNGQRILANYLGLGYPVRIDTSLSFPDTGVQILPEDSLIALALKENPSYRTSLLTLQAQRVNELAVRLMKVPQLGGSFTYGYQGNHFLSNWADNDFWTLGIQLNWNIFEGLRYFAQLRETSIQTRTAVADSEIARNSASEEMHQAYSNLILAREALSIAQVVIEEAQEEFRLVSEQFRLGAASSLDLLQSQFALEDARRQQVQIITDFYIAQAQIQRLLGTW